MSWPKEAIEAFKKRTNNDIPKKATGGIISDSVPAMLGGCCYSGILKNLDGKYFHTLKELNDMPDKEKVLVFPKKIFEQLGYFTGTMLCREGTHITPKRFHFSPPMVDNPPTTTSPDVEPHSFLQTPSFQSSLFYMDRDSAETDENFLQLIPYCVLSCREKFFIYQRTKKGGESRLHDKWSLGVGGHLNPCDGEPSASYDDGMTRELQEEVGLLGNYENKVLGLLYDNSNAVGRVHFGVIHLIEVEDENVLHFKDPALDKGQWVGYDWLLENVEKFENWSQLTIEHLG